MGVYSTTAANAYADKIKAVYEALDEIRKVADRLTPVEDLAGFQAQIGAIHAQLDLLVEASNLIVTATPTGESILTGSVASIKTLLEIGVLPENVVLLDELNAALATLEASLQSDLTTTNNDLTAISIVVNQLDQYRVSQQTSISGLQTDYSNIQAGLETNQTNLTTALQRLTVTEQNATLVDQSLDSINQSLASTISGLQAANSTIAGHTASITTAENAITIQAASIDALSSSLTDTNTNVTANATALNTLQTTVTGIGNDLTAQSQQTTVLGSVIGGSGNLLPNADFAVGASGWAITVAEEDWANTLLTVNTLNMPTDVNCLEVVGAPTPLGQIIVESSPVLVIGNRHYIVSGYPCVDNGTVVLSYKLFDSAGSIVGQGVCPPTFNTTTSTDFSGYTRTWVKFLASAGAVKLRLYLTVTGDGDFITQGALFRPMVEQAWVDQAGPSAWVPNTAGAMGALEGNLRLVESALINEMITSANNNAALVATTNELSTRIVDVEADTLAAANAVQSLTTRVTAAEGVNTSQGSALTSLQAQVTALDLDTGGSGAAIAALDTRVTATEASIVSQGSAITALQNSVTSANRTTVSETAPATAGRTENDLWIQASTGNIYTLTSGVWVLRPNNKNRVFAQPTQPTAENVGDFWLDTDDGNRPWRWNGTTWIDMTDTRITGNASAISSLTTRVTAAEGVNTSQGSAITSLENTVNNGTTGVAATASALSSLTTRVTNTENTNTSQASAITNVTSRMTTAEGNITAQASATSTLSTQMTTVQGRATALEARWGVSLDVNGYISGVSSVNNGSVATTTFIADNFRIVTPGQSPRTLFSISSGGNTEFANDMYFGNGRIILDSGTHILVQGVGFGVANEFVQWYGPKMAINLCNRAQADMYLTRTGGAYFGGSLSTGVLKNAVTSSTLSGSAIVETGAFGTNGGPKIVTYSLSYRNAGFHATDLGNGTLSATITLERSYNGGAWTNVGSVALTGNRVSEGFEPGSGYSHDFNLAGSATFTDNLAGTGNFNYRVVVTSPSGWPYTMNVQNSQSQRTSVVSTES